MSIERLRHRGAMVMILFSLISIAFGQGSGDAPTQVATDTDASLRRMASERWHTWRRARKTLPVGAWSYFQRFEGTRKEYETYRDAGLNVVMPPLSQYSSAAATGMDIILGQFEPLHTSQTLLEKIVAFPTPTERQVVGYMLMDEPMLGDFPGLARAYRYIYENDRRDAIPILDFRPNWAVPYPPSDGSEPSSWVRRFQGLTYEQYLDRFIEECVPCVLLNCHYAIMTDGSTRDVFYDNIELFRRKALERNIGLMGFVLVTPLTKDPEQDYRTPSESDLWWTVYSHLAYGAQGIWYYNWRIRKDKVFGEAMVNYETGEPSAVYPLVARVNKEVAAIGPTLMKLRSVAVHHTGELVPPGTTRYAPDRVTGVVEWKGDDFLIGEFRNQDDPDDRDVYLMIVNKRHAANTNSKDLAAQASFRLLPPYGPLRAYSVQTGETSVLPSQGGGRYALELGGGQAALLRYSRRSD